MNNRSHVLIVGAFFAGLVAGFGDHIGAILVAALAIFVVDDSNEEMKR